MKPRGRWEFTLACVVISIACAFSVLIGEGIIRVLYPQELGNWTYTRDGLTLHLPNTRRTSVRFGHEIATNSSGMRDREHSIEKNPGVFRILVLGDSFMEAHQVKFEDSFSSLLEQMLGEISGRSVEVINASVSGWGTDDELTYLMREGVRYKPDLIVLAMTLHNDVSDNLEEEYHTLRNGRLEERPATSVPGSSFALLKLKEWLASHSHVYQLVLQAVRRKSVLAEAKDLESHVGALLKRTPTDRVTRGWEMTGKLFEKIVEVARENNAGTMVVLLPLLVQVYPQELPRFLESNNLREEDVEIERPQEIMKALANALGFSVIDLLPTFVETQRKCGCALFVRNDGHWNEKGHLIAATAVAESILASSVMSSR